MVALLAGDYLVTRGLICFEKILANQFEGGFCCFRATGGEVHAATIMEIFGGDGENPRG
jgi:hypothetical protein